MKHLIMLIALTMLLFSCSQTKRNNCPSFGKQTNAFFKKQVMYYQCSKKTKKARKQRRKALKEAQKRAEGIFYITADSLTKRALQSHKQ